MASFDFPYTCPKVDKAIGEAKSNIQSDLDDILSDACGLLPARERGDLAQQYTEKIYKNIEDCFEAVRDTNCDMRDAAESQIRSLESKVSDLEFDIENLKRQLENQE